eukprot:5698760-Pleurochrysis_carterae.AAC.3
MAVTAAMLRPSDVAWGVLGVMQKHSHVRTAELGMPVDCRDKRTGVHAHFCRQHHTQIRKFCRCTHLQVGSFAYHPNAQDYVQHFTPVRAQSRSKRCVS